MSCRVLGRRVEEACLAHLAAAARQADARALIGRYIPSAKNAMVKDHYRKLGFSQESEADGTTTWRLDLDAYVAPALGDEGRRSNSEKGKCRRMSAVNEKPLDALLGERPASLALANIALTAWPEHDKFLIRSFRQRSSEVLDATEIVSTAILKLIDGDERRFGEDYRWTCDRLREEEIFFHREGRYRLSTFADACAEVYSNHEYMRRYVGGLLLTQALWFNHVATMEMFLSRVLGATTGAFDYLEIGPGHGLMTYFAAESKLARSLEAWDVSSVSLEETKAALGKLGVPKPVALVETDILQAGGARRRFDLVVMSEVLEHLEAQVIVLTASCVQRSRMAGKSFSTSGSTVPPPTIFTSSPRRTTSSP